MKEKSEYNYDTCTARYYRSQAIRAAKDLKYGPKVIEKIREAESASEIARIMKTAREQEFEDIH